MIDNKIQLRKEITQDQTSDPRQLVQISNTVSPYKRYWGKMYIKCDINRHTVILQGNITYKTCQSYILASIYFPCQTILAAVAE